MNQTPDEIEVIDLGDAFEETKQSMPGGIYADSQFGMGWRPGDEKL